MNRLANPGWETAGATESDAASWTRDSVGAYRYGVGYRSGAWAGVLLRSASSLVPPITYSAGYWQQDGIAVSAGSLVEVAVYAYQAAASGVVARLLVDGIEVDRAADDGGWQRLSALVTPTASTISVRIDLVGIGGTAASWIVDDASAEDVAMGFKRGTHQAFKALYERLREINGATGGYWHDVGGRVYARLIQPGEAAAPQEPYVCLALRDDGAIEIAGPEYVRTTIDVDVYGFPKATAASDIENCSSVTVAKLYDDILKCLMPTNDERPYWHLGEPTIVSDVRFTSKRLMAEQVEADTGSVPAHVRLTVSIDVINHPDLLGPEE